MAPFRWVALLLGCDRFRFQNFSGVFKTYNVSTCVSERTGPQAYTDAAPSLIALVGPNYPPPADACPSNSITPLTNNKTFLKSQIDLLQAAGSTAGHIGVAWGWYLLSPNWGNLWPSASQPAPYSDLDVLDAMGRPLLRKIIILMTDGEFNTAYCQGVISHDSTSGSTSDHIWCNAPDSSFNQARNLCANAKGAGVIVYTIGFGLGTGPSSAGTLMTNCATDEFTRVLGVDRRRAPTSLPRYRDPDRLSQVDELSSTLIGWLSRLATRPPVTLLRQTSFRCMGARSSRRSPRVAHLSGSHWAVDSHAIVKLFTQVIGAMALDKTARRSEFLRQ